MNKEGNTGHGNHLIDCGGMKCHDIKKIQSVVWNLSVIDKQDKIAPAPSLASLHLCYACLRREADEVAATLGSAPLN